MACFICGPKVVAKTLSLNKYHCFGLYIKCYTILERSFHVDSKNPKNIFHKFKSRKLSVIFVEKVPRQKCIYLFFAIRYGKGRGVMLKGNI